MLKQIILDTETTGLDVKTGHRIIEIGCVELISRKFTGNEYQTYLNPGRAVDEGAEKVHGLSNQFLGDKPEFKEIVDEFLSFIEGSELLIHNAEFDIGFLDYELKLLRGENASILKHVHSVTDTLKVARGKHPGQKNSLDALVRRYEIKGYDRGYHGALLDSKILGDVYLALTGGQSDLNFVLDGSEKEGKEDLNSQDYLFNGSKRPKVIKLSPEEELLHLQYLENMYKDSQVKPIGLKDKS